MTIKVLFLQPQPCIRALKYAEGFTNSKADVKLYFAYLNKTLSELYGYGDEFFSEWVKLNKDKDKAGQQIKKMVEKHNIDIIHSHNAPDNLTVAAIEAMKGTTPVIHDVHNLLTQRRSLHARNWDEIERFEKRANEESDGRIFVSGGLRVMVERKYDVDETKNLTYLNFVPKNSVPEKLRKKLSSQDGETHIVYEGSIDGKHKGSHYYLMDIFRKIAEQGIHIHIYVSRGGEEYKELEAESRYIHFHGHLGARELLDEITQYDFGWAGFNIAENVEHLHVVLPNKAMEYIACGLPIISFPHRTQKTFIKRYEVGVVINDINELRDELKKSYVKKLKSEILKKRYKFTVEGNIQRVVDFYNMILASKE